MTEDDCYGYDDSDGPEPCDRCDGTGVEMVCIDDMCQGSGECIHGDGEITCRSCKGLGEV